MKMNEFLPMSMTVTRGGKKEVITVCESVTTFFAPAKVMAMNVIDLLYGDAAEAEKIAGHKPLFTKEEYLDHLNSLESAVTFGC